MLHDMTPVERAAEFARLAHESINQRRKYTDEPYIVHPARVAELVASVTDDENMLCAAWLHDVVEDTPVTLAQIHEEFGADVAELVRGLTKVSTRSDGDRASRVAIDRQDTASTDSRTQTIKLADMIANLDGITKQDPRFARNYLKEKEQLLAAMPAGDATLRSRLEQIINFENSQLRQ